MLDPLVAALVLIFFVFGVLSGLLFQVLRLASTVVSILLALSFTAPTMAAFPHIFSDYPQVRAFLFPAAIFCIAYVGFVLLASLIVRIFRKTSPVASSVDRLLGGLVGMVKGILLSYFLVSILLSVESELGRPLPYLDTKKSFVAHFVSVYSLGRVREWSLWPRIEETVEGLLDSKPNGKSSKPASGNKQ